MNTSKRSKKGSKRKAKGGRSSSAHRQRTKDEDEELGEDDPNNHLKPDIEAEEIYPNKRKEPIPLGINREDLFKPISEYEREKLNNQEANISPEKGDGEENGSSKSKAKKKKKTKRKK